MSDLDYDILLKYKSNLEGLLDDSEARLKDHLKKVESMGIKLTYQLDQAGLEKQVADLRQKLEAAAKSTAVTSASTATPLTGMVKQAQTDADALRGILEKTVTTMRNGEKVITSTTVKRQSGNNIITSRFNDKNEETSTSIKSRDRESDLKRELKEQTLVDNARAISAAKGAGDVRREIDLLEQRRKALEKIAQAYQDIASSPAYRQVESGYRRTDEKIANLEKKNERGVNDSLDNQRKREEAQRKSVLSALDRQRDRELTKQKNQERSVLGSLDRQRNQEQGRQSSYEYDKENRRARQFDDLVEDDYQGSRKELEARKAMVTSAAQLSAIEKQIAALDAARINSLQRSAVVYREMARLAEQAGQLGRAGRNDTLANLFVRRASTLDKNLGGEQNKNLVDARKRDYEREITDAKRLLDQKLLSIEADKRAAKSIADVVAREKELKRVRESKALALRDFAAINDGVGQRAGLAGFRTVERTATGRADKARLDADRSLLPDVNKLGAAAEKNKKSFGGIVETFLRWNVAARLVGSSLNVINTALDGAVKVDRQFAVLRSIFRGTADEAQKLKNDVLDLAVANGRSADEALAAATGFARLGLSRANINKLVETSLVAANVAELTSQDAAEKLTSLMQQYGLSVDEVSAALNRLNSISNTNNVTVGQLLSNISLVAAVAKQAGIALEDLEGIVGVTVAATKATTSEIGNALKFVLQRIRKEESLEKFKLEFDIDLTKANGDLREGTEILAELARIYPLLNKAEQSRLLDLAAGTRQAARFATVLENFNKAQFTTANAVGDTNSAMRENESITSSLSSQMQSLETAWVQFAVAIGDTGIIDIIADKIADLAGVLSDATNLLTGEQNSSERDRDGNARNIKASNNKDRAALDFFGDARDSASFIDRKVFSEKELQDFQKAIPIIEKYQNALLDLELSKPSGPERLKGRSAAYNTLAKELGAIGFNNVTPQQAAYLNRLSGTEISRVDEFTAKNLKDSQGNTQQKTLQFLRGRLEEFTRGATSTDRFADGIAEQAAAGVADPRKIRKDFEDLRNVIVDLPDGAEKFQRSFVIFNRALESGDYATVEKELRSLAGAMRKELPAASEAYSQEQSAQIADQEKALFALEQAKNNALKGDAKDTGLIESLSREITDVQEKIREIRREVEETKFDILSPGQVSQLNNLQDVIKSRVESARDSLLANTGGERTNTPSSQLARTISGNATLLDTYRGNLDATRLRRAIDLGNASPRSPLPSRSTYLNQIGIDGQQEAYQKIKDQSDALVQSAELRVNAELKNVDALNQQALAAQRALEIQKAMRDGKDDYDIASSRFGVGVNAGEQIMDRLRGNLQIFQQSVDGIAGNGMRDALARNSSQVGGPLGQYFSSDRRVNSLDEQARLTTTALTAQEAAQQSIIDLRKREQEIMREQTQAAIDLAKQEKQRTDEMSKRLAMASREEQLTAAFLAASTSRLGPITSGQFLGMSQNTRGIADAYGMSPFSGGPGDTSSPQGQYNQRMLDLSEEMATVFSSVASAMESVKQNQKIIEANLAKGGIFDTVGSLANESGTALQPGISDTNASVVLNANGTIVNISLAKTTQELAATLGAQMDANISRQIAEIRREFRRTPSVEPDVSPATSIGSP
jgi:TP901 family phage tail tape measure protein